MIEIREEREEREGGRGPHSLCPDLMKRNTRKIKSSDSIAS
jgi:hypothetical protein